MRPYSSEAQRGPTLVIVCPKELVGRLIGKQGSNINAIKHRTNCRISVNQDDNQPDAPACVYVSGGTDESRAHAKELVEGTIEDGWRYLYRTAPTLGSLLNIPLSNLTLGSTTDANTSSTVRSSASSSGPSTGSVSSPGRNDPSNRGTVSVTSPRAGNSPSNESSGRTTGTREGSTYANVTRGRGRPGVWVKRKPQDRPQQQSEALLEPTPQPEVGPQAVVHHPLPSPSARQQQQQQQPQHKPHPQQPEQTQGQQTVEVAPLKPAPSLTQTPLPPTTSKPPPPSTPPPYTPAQRPPMQSPPSMYTQPHIPPAPPTQQQQQPPQPQQSSRTTLHAHATPFLPRSDFFEQHQHQFIMPPQFYPTPVIDPWYYDSIALGYYPGPIYEYGNHQNVTQQYAGGDVATGYGGGDEDGGQYWPGAPAYGQGVPTAGGQGAVQPQQANMQPQTVTPPRPALLQTSHQQQPQQQPVMSPREAQTGPYGHAAPVPYGQYSGVGEDVAAYGYGAPYGAGMAPRYGVHDERNHAAQQQGPQQQQRYAQSASASLPEYVPVYPQPYPYQQYAQQQHMQYLQHQQQQQRRAPTGPMAPAGSVVRTKTYPPTVLPEPRGIRPGRGGGNGLGMPSQPALSSVPVGGPVVRATTDTSTAYQRRTKPYQRYVGGGGGGSQGRNMMRAEARGRTQDARFMHEELPQTVAASSVVVAAGPGIVGPPPASSFANAPAPTAILSRGTVRSVAMDSSRSRQGGTPKQQEIIETPSGTPAHTPKASSAAAAADEALDVHSPINTSLDESEMDSAVEAVAEGVCGLSVCVSEPKQEGTEAERDGGKDGEPDDRTRTPPMSESKAGVGGWGEGGGVDAAAVAIKAPIATHEAPADEVGEEGGKQTVGIGRSEVDSGDVTTPETEVPDAKGSSGSSDEHEPASTMSPLPPRDSKEGKQQKRSWTSVVRTGVQQS